MNGGNDIPMNEPTLFLSGNFSALAWDTKNSRLAAYDRGQKAVRVFSSVGKQVYRMEELDPLSMCFDVYGRLLACDRSFRAVVRRDHYGSVEFASEYSGGATDPQAILVHSCGAYYMLGQRALYYIIPEGRAVFDACGGAALDYCGMCMAGDEAGLVFTRRRDARLVFCEFSPEGTLGIERTLVFGGDYWQACPQAICSDRRGNIYCAAGERLFVFSRSGRLLGSGDYGPIHSLCAVGPEDRVFMSLPDGIFSLEVYKDA